MPENPVPPHRTPEALLAHAQEQIAKIEQDREIARLLQQGWTGEQIVAHLGVEPYIINYIRSDLAEGLEARPVTPYELGMRRTAGLISTEDMMTQLKAWPYTFGTLHYDWWDRGSWDDIGLLRSTGFLTVDEYREIRSAIDHPDDRTPN